MNGGTEDKNLDTRAACEYECRNNVDCFGYDYSNACYLHLEADTDYEDAEAEDGVDQYRKVKCDGKYLEIHSIQFHRQYTELNGEILNDIHISKCNGHS